MLGSLCGSSKSNFTVINNIFLLYSSYARVFELQLIPFSRVLCQNHELVEETGDFRITNAFVRKRQWNLMFYFHPAKVYVKDPVIPDQYILK